jgi:sialic acid synthase SpsE
MPLPVFNRGRNVTNFIAEICSNHNGNLNRALALIDTAAAIGCYGVKFQLFRLEQLYAPEVLAHPDYQFVRDRRAWELPLDWLPYLKERCQMRGIRFGCTPFHLEAVEQLEPFVDFYKVASYNLLHNELLVKVARTGKPVILSTGAATALETRQAIDRILIAGCEKLTALHCVSAYPTPINQIRPGAFRLLKRLCKTYKSPVSIGWSDHTVQPVVIWDFIFRGEVDVIEFHLDLDGYGNEHHLGHCWLPEQIQPIIDAHRLASSAVYPDELSPVEQAERLWRADPSDGLRPMKETREKL